MSERKRYYRYLRQQSEIPVAQLSNGTLFSRPSVREGAIVLTTVDAEGQPIKI